MAQTGRHSISQGTFISTDSETIGFDHSSGSKWIYPENYPRRDYQFAIVQTALYSNTLVCLPTGLGKTFIAAVVMYNFWRWYPRGKVVFLAPTKPLVAQQINACHEIMGIPSEETVELTGAINQNKRSQAWAQKRVIFATPQTFQKDLQNDYVPYELIKCVVIDEAHKALGKHSYCEIVRMLSERNKFFRVLALSATPGSKIDHVREVIQNLQISDLELRDDTSPDITPYTNDRLLDKIIVQLDPVLKQYKDRYISVMDPHVRILIKSNLLQGSADNISKGRIFMLMKQYESRPQKAFNHGTIMKTLNILLTMYHAYELLMRHGLRAFYNFYQSHSDKFWFEAEVGLQSLLEEIKQYIGDFPVIQASHDEEIPDLPDNLVFGHSKFETLRELLVNHFKSFSERNESTRAIVFVEYRDIVNEVYILLLQARPLIRPQMFVGQAGQKQKLQLAALEDFRDNKVNVLISTSVGEEGLDVGEVDLIVCFDISTSTPTRLVQRMGRTGRKRNGRVVLLLTEGKEVQTLNQAMSKKDSLNNKVLQSSNITSSLYQSSPRMVPKNIKPECLPIFIKAIPKTPKEGRTKKTKGPTEKTKVQTEKIKEPAAKKSRKKKKDVSMNDDSIFLPNPADQVSKLSGNNQPSMMKFLTDNRQNQKRISFSNNNYDSDSGILSEEFQIPNYLKNIDNPYALIRPDEVKLLTSDSHALEFLTLCAMKKSEKYEIDDYEYIKIDKTWLPNHSPVREDFFEKIDIPSLDCLDCIKYLTLYDKNEDEDVVEIDDFCRNIHESNYFEDHSTNRTDGFDDDYPRIESKYVNENQQQRQELNDDDFVDDFSPIESKYKNPQTEYELSASGFQDDFEKRRSISQNTTVPEPATIEVNFSAILDEYSESEASLTPANIPEDVDNIFDELLNDDSSTDEDIFANSNQTIVSNDRTITGKRSASRSPCNEVLGLVKKRKLSDEVFIDNDAGVKVVDNQIDGEKKDVIYPDSDQDLFSDLEEMNFETQFSFEKQRTNLQSLEKESYSPSPIKSEKKINKDITDIHDETTDSFIEDLIITESIGHCEKSNSKSESLNTQNVAGVSQINWDDEIDFNPVVKKVSPEKFSSFFSKPSSNIESGWINPDFQPRKALAVKNLNIPTKTFKDREFKIPDIPKKSEVDPKIQTARISRPLSLKLKVSPIKLNRPNDLEFKVPSYSKRNKENENPNSKSNRISQKLRKYHSDNDLPSKKNSKKFRKRIVSEYIEDEAEVSSDYNTSEGSSDEDKDLEDFVSYTQDIPDEVDMRAHYLRSINQSPVRPPGAFLFREPRNEVPDIDIYSQVATQHENTYMHDSFCVGDETQINDHSESDPEISILEHRESSLRSRRRKMLERKENNKLKFKCLEKNKKIHIDVIKNSSSSSSTNFSNSSEDETEALRRQIMEESMLMKM